MRPLTLLLCALALAAGAAVAVAVLTRPDGAPPVRAIELGDDAPAATPTSVFAPRTDDDADDDDPFDDDD